MIQAWRTLLRRHLVVVIVNVLRRSSRASHSILEVRPLRAVMCFSQLTKVAESKPEQQGKSFEQLEKELLNGQKLQGTLTSREVFEFLEARGRLEGYPLFEKVYRIAFEEMDPKRLFEDL